MNDFILSDRCLHYDRIVFLVDLRTSLRCPFIFRAATPSSACLPVKTFPGQPPIVLILLEGR